MRDKYHNNLSDIRWLFVVVRFVENDVLEAWFRHRVDIHVGFMIVRRWFWHDGGAELGIDGGNGRGRCGLDGGGLDGGTSGGGGVG